MNRMTKPYLFFAFIILAVISACNPEVKSSPGEADIVPEPEKIDVHITRNITQTLKFAIENQGKLNDTILLKMETMADSLYIKNEYKPIWSREAAFLPLADSLLTFIENCKRFGLFPSDYHNRALHGMRSMLLSDSITKMNASVWAAMDLMYTDAFLLLGKHLKQGRLKYDSVTLRTDSLLGKEFYQGLLRQVTGGASLSSVFHQLEPQHAAYDSLKLGLNFFLDSIKNFQRFTYVIYPNKDSVALYAQVQKRLYEDSLLSSPTDPIDTATFRSVIRNYQKSKGLKVTGKLNVNTANALNNTSWEQFKTIALNMDRYKLLPDTLPERFIWVNIPSFYMQVWDTDSLVFLSRVVVGKPDTRTPLLSSRITDMITYPQWTIPTSIIVKEVIPGVKKNPEYFNKHGYSLVDDKGNEVDPYNVDWNRYTKGIPYKVVQGSGDANALGILKFNFSNKYSVYLHDTNQRYLFKNAMRSLSHGCVRVQEWQKLAHYLLNIDSMNRKTMDITASYAPSDSLRVWMKRKEKHYLQVRSRMPLFIRYFTCAGQGGKLRFYEDIYGEDKLLKERYFADKSIQ